MLIVWLICSTPISIHTLLAESDVSSMLYDTTSLVFLSTLSLRRATAGCYCKHKRHEISIHTLLAESDLPCLFSWDRLTNFYPHSPCGERPDTPK